VAYFRVFTISLCRILAKQIEVKQHSDRSARMKGHVSELEATNQVPVLKLILFQ